MKIIGTTKTKPDFNLLSVIEGYDIFIQNHYLSPISFCKEGCQIWINYKDNDYLGLEITDRKTWTHEVACYIQSNLPRKEEPFCRFIPQTDEFINNINKPFFVMELSGMIFNRDGNILTKIIAFKRDLPSDFVENSDDSIVCLPTIEIIVRNCKQESSINVLIDNILHRDCIKKYKGKRLWYRITEKEDYSSRLGFSLTNYGFSFREIE